MERKKHLLTMIVLLLLFSIQAVSSNKKSIYQAFVYSRMEEWKQIIDAMETNKQKTDEFLHELVNFQYGYIGYCLGENDKSGARKYLELAEKNLETLEKTGFNPAIIHAYHSAFWGFKISMSPWKAPVYGRRSINHVNQAIEIDKNMAFVHVQYGLAYFYMPAIFGGSKKVAVEHFLVAQNLMETTPDEIKYDWNYLNLLTLIGQSYEEIKEYEKAKTYYLKTLAIEPEFQWVKDELYPNLMNKMNNEK